MDPDTSEKIRDVISFVHSRTLSIGVYSPGDISVTNMYEEAASDLAEIIKQEIAKAKIDENNRWRTILAPSFDHNTVDMEDFNDRAVELKQELEKL